LTFLPWLSLRAVFRTAGARTLFCELPRRVDCVNALASLSAHGLMVVSLVRLRQLLPLPGWLAWPLVAGAAGLFIGGRRRGTVAAISGAALAGLATARGDAAGVLLGAACLALWLVLAWESREAWRNWLIKPLQLHAINVGSAKTLRGRVRVMHLFLDAPQRPWRRRDRSQVLHIVDQACRWIVASAQRYRAPLKFEHVVVNPSTLAYPGPIPTPDNDQIGQEEFQAFVAEAIRRVEGLERRADSAQHGDPAAADNTCLLIHVSEHIGHVAYARPERRRQTHGRLAVEYAVVGAWRNAAIYAHEILHLFGASDYRLSKFDDRAEVHHWDQLRESMLWRSIMFDGYHAIHRLVVDQQTAQCVGWM
jgi:hypothetical protein